MANIIKKVRIKQLGTRFAVEVTFMIFLKFKNNYFFLFYKRKLIFKKFGFKNQEKDDNPYLDNILDKITGVKKFNRRKE